MKRSDTLLWILGGAILLWIASRTSAGQQAIATGVDAVTGSNWLTRAAATAGSLWDDLFSTLSTVEQDNDIPTGLLTRVAYQESHFRPDIISGQTASPAGAVGLMQLIPRFYPGVDPLNTDQAIDAAAKSLVSYRNQFGSWPLALAAYNAGPGNVQKYNGIPPFPETQAYVSQIMADVPGAANV